MTEKLKSPIIMWLLEPISKVAYTSRVRGSCVHFRLRASIPSSEYLDIPRQEIVSLARKLTVTPTGLLLRWVLNRS